MLLDAVTQTPPLIAICLIVKNESQVILRCLESVKPFISFVLIEDTGSTDGTQEMVKEWLLANKVKGLIYDRPWVDFADNRSSVLAHMRDYPDIDYALIMDADDEFVIDDLSSFKRSLCDLLCDHFNLRLVQGGSEYSRIQIVSNRLSYHYRGVLHEFIVSPEGSTVGTLNHCHIRSNREGARSLDCNKYLKDIEVLKSELEHEIDPFMVSRYTFYLAQSCRDAGLFADAIKYYLRRSELEFWVEERYVALLNAGRLIEAHHPELDNEIIDTYKRAILVNPTRAEAYHGLVCYLRLKNRFHDAYELGMPGLRCMAKDGLFIEKWIYDYGLKDELAVSAYWADFHPMCLQLCVELLESPSLPCDHRERILANADHARSSIQQLLIRHQSLLGRKNQPAKEKALGGTELMVEGLMSRLSYDHHNIRISVNALDDKREYSGKNIVWLHHDIDQPAVQWLQRGVIHERISAFVFVSSWQRERYLKEFKLPPERCHVMRNATSVPEKLPSAVHAGPLKILYISTPFRGLDVALDAWEGCHLADAEFHVFSSMKLYNMSDDPWASLISRAQRIKGVHYHGIVGHEELMQFILGCDMLFYPCTFLETSCLAAIDAMSLGLRIITPEFGALPETCAGFARHYIASSDHATHVQAARVALTEEIDRYRAEHLPHRREVQHAYCRLTYDWEVRVKQWNRFLSAL